MPALAPATVTLLAAASFLFSPLLAPASLGPLILLLSGPLLSDVLLAPLTRVLLEAGL